MRIDQFLAGFTPGDGISDEAVEIQKIIRQMGHDSEIFVWPAFLHRDGRAIALPLTDYVTSSESTGVIYHFSIGSGMSEFVRDLRARKVMIYHNVTPSRYLKSYSQTIAQELDAGREQLATLHTSFDLALADSEYNRKELEDLGYSATGVLPILLNQAKYACTPDPKILRARGDHKVIVLHVSRLFPSKCQHDLVKAFYVYRKFIEPNSRLVLVGGHSLPVYVSQIRRMIADLDLEPHVLMTGHVTNAQLLAYYSISDVFVSMSEHEGFSIPIVESFMLGLPVIAFSAGAVPETIGQAGLLLDSKDPDLAAEAIHIVCSSEDLRADLKSRGRERFHMHFRPEVVREKLKTTISQVFQRVDSQAPGSS